jgi:hypothetical protein
MDSPSNPFSPAILETVTLRVSHSRGQLNQKLGLSKLELENDSGESLKLNFFLNFENLLHDSFLAKF